MEKKTSSYKQFSKKKKKKNEVEFAIRLFSSSVQSGAPPLPHFSSGDRRPGIAEPVTSDRRQGDPPRSLLCSAPPTDLICSAPPLRPPVLLYAATLRRSVAPLRSSTADCSRRQEHATYRGQASDQ
ncbi:unnamed protein product [Linum trigynum]|uniref:Uncharacterized protein n=1 Tax=Linum trigynum TaxID=586398 RepID=A0AAV2GTI8_9ROSI